MQLEDMMRYTDAGSLLIVGNRIKAHENALRAGAAVLITGALIQLRKTSYLQIPWIYRLFQQAMIPLP